MKKKQGVVVIILAAVLIGLLIFTTAVGFGPTGTGSAKTSRQAWIWQEVSVSRIRRRTIILHRRICLDTIYKLQKRVENYSEEAQVYQGRQQPDQHRDTGCVGCECDSGRAG